MVSLSNQKNSEYQLGPQFIQNVFMSLLVFPCTLLPGSKFDFHKLHFWILSSSLFSRKAGKSKVIQVILEAFAAGKVHAFCSESLSTMISIYQNYGGIFIFIMRLTIP